MKISYCIKQKIQLQSHEGRTIPELIITGAILPIERRAVKNLNTSITKRKDNIACLLAFDSFGTVRMHMLLSLKQDKVVLVTY